MHVLTGDDWAFWEEQGYVIVHDAVPPENVRAVVDALWEFQASTGTIHRRGTAIETSSIASPSSR